MLIKTPSPIITDVCQQLNRLCVGNHSRRSSPSPESSNSGMCVLLMHHVMCSCYWLNGMATMIPKVVYILKLFGDLQIQTQSIPSSNQIIIHKRKRGRYNHQCNLKTFTGDSMHKHICKHNLPFLQFIPYRRTRNSSVGIEKTSLKDTDE